MITSSFRQCCVIAFLFTVISISAGCAVMTIDVDVYKGPLSNDDDVQLAQLVECVNDASVACSVVKEALIRKFPADAKTWQHALDEEKKSNVSSTEVSGIYRDLHEICIKAKIISQNNVNNELVKSNKSFLLDVVKLGDKMSTFGKFNNVRMINNDNWGFRNETEVQKFLSDDLDGSLVLIQTLGNVLTAHADELIQRQQYKGQELNTGNRDRIAIRHAFRNSDKAILEAIEEMTTDAPSSSSDFVALLKSAPKPTHSEAITALETNLAGLRANTPNEYASLLKSRISAIEPQYDVDTYVRPALSAIKKVREKPSAIQPLSNSKSIAECFNEIVPDDELERKALENLKADALKKNDGQKLSDFLNEKEETWKKEKEKSAQAVSVKMAMQEVFTSRQGIDSVVSVLQYQLLNLNKNGLPKEKADAGITLEQETKRLENAIAYAADLRKGMIYLRPPASFLRATFIPGKTGVGSNGVWRNEMAAQSRKSLPFYEKLPWVNTQRTRTAAYLDQFHWQNVNHIRVVGTGKGNKVVVKDDVGNWYVKGFEEDPTEVSKAMLQLALASTGKTAVGNADLFKKRDAVTAASIANVPDLEQAQQDEADRQAEATVRLAGLRRATDAYEQGMASLLTQMSVDTRAFATTNKLKTVAPSPFSGGEPSEATLAYHHRIIEFLNALPPKPGDGEEYDAAKVTKFREDITIKVIKERDRLANELQRAINQASAKTPAPIS